MDHTKRLDLLILAGVITLALAVRLPGLTVFITADEARSWYGRSLIFLDSLARGDWANTAPGGEADFIENVSLSPAPGVTTMWSGATGIILEYLRQGRPGSLTEFLRRVPFDPLDPALLFWLRLPGLLLAALAAGLTFWWSRPLLGRRGALLAAGLLALDPFYLALSRVLGHDAPVTTFMWLSLLAFMRAVSGGEGEQPFQEASRGSGGAEAQRRGGAGEQRSRGAEEPGSGGAALPGGFAREQPFQEASRGSGGAEAQRRGGAGEHQDSTQYAIRNTPQREASLWDAPRPSAKPPYETPHAPARSLPVGRTTPHFSLFTRHSPRSTFLLISGALAGLAFLSKYPALFLGGFVALVLLVNYLSLRSTYDSSSTSFENTTADRGPGTGAEFIAGRPSPAPGQRWQKIFIIGGLPLADGGSDVIPALKRWFIDLALWSLAAGVTFVLFWPAMWVEPVGTVTTIIGDALRASGGSHAKGSFFLGRPVPDPGALFYPLIILLRTTPVLLIGVLLSLWAVVAETRRRGVEEPGSRGAGEQGSIKTLRNTQYAIRPSAKPPCGTPHAPVQSLSVERSAPHSSLITHHSSLVMFPTTLILLAYIVLYTLLITYGGKKQDRYILPAFPALAMLAVIGYLHLSQFIRRSSLLAPPSSLVTHHVSRFTFYVSRFTPHSSLLPALLICLQLLLILPAHPYYFTYYNPLAGGGRTAARTVQVGWGEGLDRAAAYLNTLPRAESTEVVAWYSTAFEPYFKGKSIYKIDDEKISRSTKPGLAADYVVFYINQVQRGLPSDGALQYFTAVSPVYTVTLQGLDYAWVYPSVGMTHVISDEVRLVGQGELLGYDLQSEAGEPVTGAYPESVVILSLYWEWQGKAEDEPIGLSLVDDTGQTRAWGNPIETVAPLPYDRWQEGMVVRNDYALVIFPDTPPGEYRLAAWIDRPATGETVGVFPLEDRVKLPIVPREAEVRQMSEP